MPIRTLRAIRPVPGTDGHGPAHQAPDHAAMTQSTNSRSAEACCVHQSAFVAVSTATTAHGATIATTRKGDQIAIGKGDLDALGFALPVRSKRGKPAKRKRS